MLLPFTARSYIFDLRPCYWLGLLEQGQLIASLAVHLDVVLLL